MIIKPPFGHGGVVIYDPYTVTSKTDFANNLEDHIIAKDFVESNIWRGSPMDQDLKKKLVYSPFSDVIDYVLKRSNKYIAIDLIGIASRGYDDLYALYNLVKRVLARPISGNAARYFSICPRFDYGDSFELTTANIMTNTFYDVILDSNFTFKDIGLVAGGMEITLKFLYRYTSRGLIDLPSIGVGLVLDNLSTGSAIPSELVLKRNDIQSIIIFNIGE